MTGHDEQYKSLAGLYDALYHWKDYAREAEALGGLLVSRGIEPGARIVEAACGTGSHLVHLRGHFQVCGFDLNAEMLALAKAKVPDVPLWVADMADFTVDEPCDALLCLFSSIGYLRTRPALEAAAHCFARAVRPGGVVLVEPWFTGEAWDVGRPTLHETPDRKIARATVADRDGEIAVMDMHWLIAERGQPVRHVVDRHEMWLCPHEVLQASFESAGFAVSWSDDLGDRRLLVGVRRG
jgi:SAM-dependent methyltransferase